jgi:hypothetical protein
VVTGALDVLPFGEKPMSIVVGLMVAMGAMGEIFG